MSQPMVVERHGAVTLFRMTQPASRNALSFEMKQRFIEEVPAFLADADARVLVITGSEGVFCAGGDIRTMTGDMSAPAMRRRMTSSHDWLLPLMTTEKIVITAVNGPAVGAGLSLALAGDNAVAAADAYFMGGFAKVGLAPDLGLAYTLARSVGEQRAKDILLTNRKVLPDEALAMGMVSRVVPAADLQARALELARQLADGPTLALGLTKSLVGSAYRTPAEFLQLEALAQATAFGSEQLREGVQAFLDKRKPAFHP